MKVLQRLEYQVCLEMYVYLALFEEQNIFITYYLWRKTMRFLTFFISVPHRSLSRNDKKDQKYY